MAERGMFTTTELVPLLHQRGITLSASQVHRLVTGTPERLSLMVLAALCDAPGRVGRRPHRRRPRAKPHRPDRQRRGQRRPTRRGHRTPVSDLAGRRPTRARITPS
jgi:hypothetical protein